jgi:hypothetical protein
MGAMRMPTRCATCQDRAAERDTTSRMLFSSPTSLIDEANHFAGQLLADRNRIKLRRAPDQWRRR